MRQWRLIGLFCLAGLLGACGGGGSSSSSSSPSASSPTVAEANVQPVSVTLGPEGNYPNGFFTSVTLCVPGTSNCQTVNDILVDTGSFGLRILASALTLSLPGQTDASGNSNRGVRAVHQAVHLGAGCNRERPYVRRNRERHASAGDWRRELPWPSG